VALVATQKLYLENIPILFFLDGGEYTMMPKWLIRFEEARQGRTPGIVLVFNTTDRVVYPESGILPCALKFFMAQHLTRQGFSVAGFSLSSGLQELKPPGESRQSNNSPFANLTNTKEPEKVLTSLTSVLRRREGKVALVVDYADHLVPASQGMNAILNPLHIHALEVLHSWGIDDAIKTTENLVVLISHENQVNELLTRGGSGYHVVQVDLPSLDERLIFINQLCELRKKGRTKDFGGLPEDLSPQELTRVTSGLRYTDIEEIFRLAAAKGEEVTRGIVREKKAQAISELCKELLSVNEPTYGFESVAGVPHAVDYFQTLKWRIQAGDYSVPQAICLVGVPGCGKSFIVLALAKELNYPCLAMRNVRERWVGASERNLELVLWVAETLAPCIIWIDELDQVMGQRTTGQSADAGTSERMMARIWEFMGSMKHRGKILWVATSNRPDLLDPATLDRFQVVIPFLHPTPSEVKALLPIVAKQLGRELSEDLRIDEISKIPSLNSPTVRALQEVLAEAGTLADLDSGKVGSQISHAHLEAAALDFKPNYNPMEHQFIALSAVRMTSFKSLLPWCTRQGFRKDAQLPAYLEDIVDKTTGDLDTTRLNDKIRQLQITLQGDRILRQF
jgi:SpoVK/Ycf46/Vps4 family AAA+-type ATPase